MFRIAASRGSLVVVGFLAAAGASPAPSRDAVAGPRAARRCDRRQPDERAAPLAGRPGRDVVRRVPRHHAAPRLRRLRRARRSMPASWRRPPRTTGASTPRRPPGASTGQTRTFMTAGAVRFLLVGDSTVTDEIGWGNGLPPPPHVALDGRQRGEERPQLEELPRRGSLARRARAPCRLRPDPVRPQRSAGQRARTGRRIRPRPTAEHGALRRRGQSRRGAPGDRDLARAAPVRPDGRIASDLGAYVEAAKAVAADRRVTLVDLHALGIVVLDRMGPTPLPSSASSRRTARSTARTSRRPAATCSARWWPTNSAG